jgi:hypothetical protein
MTSNAVTVETGFVDRRKSADEDAALVLDRRQFTNSHGELSPDVRELAMAIDEYKLRHRRRFVSYEEIYYVMRELGYHKD